jgi:hypothetical protein
MGQHCNRFRNLLHRKMGRHCNRFHNLLEHSKMGRHCNRFHNLLHRKMVHSQHLDRRMYHSMAA